MARPRTPALDMSQPVAGGRPTSPPETPTTASPAMSRTLASGGRGSPFTKNRRARPSQSNIRPLGGNKFSYDPRPEAISPRSSHSSDEESEASKSPPPSSPSDDMEFHGRRGYRFTTAMKNLIATNRPGGMTIHISEATFAVEDLSDCSDDSDIDIDLDVLQPDGIEDGDESDGGVRDLENIMGSHNIRSPVYASADPAFDHSDSDYDEDDDFLKSLQLQRQAKRLRRMKSGSISKRTISERGSDGSDREDVMPWLDDHELSSSYQGGEDIGPKQHRRVRRKAENRRSFLHMGFGTLPIPELKEPNSDDEIILEDSELLFRELPFFTFMEVDSE